MPCLIACFLTIIRSQGCDQVVGIDKRRDNFPLTLDRRGAELKVEELGLCDVVSRGPLCAMRRPATAPQTI